MSGRRLTKQEKKGIKDFLRAGGNVKDAAAQFAVSTATAYAIRKAMRGNHTQRPAVTTTGLDQAVVESNMTSENKLKLLKIILTKA